MHPVLNKRIDEWKENLVDLSKRNRLLNFKVNKVSTVKIVDEQPPEIYRLLVQENKTLEFLPINEQDENNSEKIELKTKEFKTYISESLDEKHTDLFLQTNLNSAQLDKNLFRISSTALSEMEEKGYNILYISLGCLEWYEDEHSDVKLESPLILIPVELKRESVKNGYCVKYNDEGILINPALELKLKRDFRIDISEINFNDDDIDAINIFEQMQQLTSFHKRWRVTNNIYLGLFSFSKFIMYKDIEELTSKIKANDIIKKICGVNSGEINNCGDLCSIDEVEANNLPLNTFQVLDADSSQQRAIAIVKSNNNLVIEGPPGTGKSQTIANIIAELMGQGKKILFVSQKSAALEVVKSRLENVGLGDFCLELHSHKTNKREIIENLANCLKNHETSDHDNNKELEKLEIFRESLNIYAKSLNSPFGNLNITPHRAIGLVSSNNEIPDYEYIFPNIETWDKNKFENGLETLLNLSNILSSLGKPELHPWAGVSVDSLGYQLNISLRNNVNDLNSLDTSISDKVRLLEQQINELYPKTLKNYNSSVELMQKIFIDDILVEVNNIGIYIDKFQNYSTSLVSKFNFNYILENFKLKKYLIQNENFSTKDIYEGLKNANQVLIEAKNLDYIKNCIEFLIANPLSDKISDIDGLSEIKKNILNLKDLKSNNGILGDNLSVMLNTNNELKNLISRYYSSVEILKNDFIIEFQECSIKDIKESSIKIINQKFNKMLEEPERLGEWADYKSTLACLKNLELEDFVNILSQKGVDFNLYSKAYERQFLLCWIDYVFIELEPLRRFSGIYHEKLIEQFRELDKKQFELAKIRLKHKLSSAVNVGTQEHISDKSQVGILERETRKKRSLMPLRRLFSYIPNLLLALKPCLMMSPTTVSQFLKSDLFEFDFVIFDEASQLPTEDAIGAIIRAKKVVVAGDNKQLPPTSFFQSAADSLEEEYSEEYIADDLGNILDECATSGINSCMLNWHYRSRHESLIAFSNKYLYNNELYTFPSAKNELGLKFNLLEIPDGENIGGYNPIEAKEVAKAVFKHFKEKPELSLGVATFNMKQRFAIEDELEELRKKDQTIESFFSSEKNEPFFIKNLESVQGDERDIIFISVGFSKKASGRLSMNFGPLNKDGGERRLNVLVTRAKMGIEIFSSIRGADFDLSATQSQGVHLLKKYLDYAEKGATVLEQDIIENNDADFDSPFEESVYNMLTRKGFIVKKQVGCSGYRIDLAVVDKNNLGEFILGIECDGATYHSSKTARDRDRLRQQVLESLGWDIYRIWSVDWFNNPVKETEKLIETIKKAENGLLKKKY